MDRKGGIGATMAVVAAIIVGVSYLPHGGGEKTGSVQGQNQNGAPLGAQTKASPNEPCDAISKRLARFVKVMPPPPDGCRETVAVPPQSKTENTPDEYDPKSGKLETVIALLPHPLQTHLPLFFDRGVEAIQDAAQDEGYNYDSSWFPWDENKRQYLSLLDEEGSHDLDVIRQKQPGVMVFRKSVNSNPNDSYETGLAVFLVGEQPTGGIDDLEFRNALAWVNALDPKHSQPLRILGPTTSGALPSLSRALRAGSNLSSWKDRPSLIVYSGTVSAEGSISGFCRDMTGIANPAAGRPPCNSSETKTAGAAVTLDFRTYEESDAVRSDRLCRYLKLQDYKVSRVAFLSEDETAYGAAPELPKGCEPDKPTEPKPMHLYYPRDISALRAAYEQESIFSSTKPASNAPSSTLRGDLTEPASTKHDTVKTYGGDLDPLAQESILMDITEQLRLNQIQYVVLSSSNTLDQVFLSQFLRRSYPESRVIIMGSDLLSLRSAQSVSLRGVMVLSTYPLIPQQQQWTATLKHKATNSFHLFGQDSAESLYIAARELIEQDSAVSVKAGGKGNSAVPIYDYAPPRWAPVPPYFQEKGNEDPHRPATWLTVIGHKRFWPVAVLNDSTIAQPKETGIKKCVRAAWAFVVNPCGKKKTATAGDGKAPPSLLTPSTDEEQGEWPAPRGEQLQFPLAMKVLLAAVGLAATWHFVCCWWGALNGPLAPFSYFAPVVRPQQRILIFLSSAAIGLGGIVLAVMAGMTRSADLEPTSLVFLFAVIAIVVGALLLWLFLSLGGSRKRVLIFLSSAAIGGIVLAFIAYRAPAELAPKPLIFLITVSAVALEASCLSVFLSCSRPRIRAEPKESGKKPTTAYETRTIKLFKREFPVPTGLVPFLGLFASLVAYAALLHYGLIANLVEANRYPTFLRSVNLFSGVSPLLPQVLFLVGLYGWCWFNLKGLTLLGRDRPYLPLKSDMDPLLRLFSRELRQAPVEHAELPAGREWIRRFGVCLVVVVGALWISLRNSALGSLGELTFGRITFGWLALLSALVLADAWQVLATWRALHELLNYLDRLRLRRTFAAMRGITWGSVWKMSGSPLEERYRVLSRLFESLLNLQNELKNSVRGQESYLFGPATPTEGPAPAALAEVEKCLDAGMVFARWYTAVCDGSRGVGFWRRMLNRSNDSILPQAGFERLPCQVFRKCVRNIGPMVRFQGKVAHTAGQLMTLVLLPWWMKETDSLIFDKRMIQVNKSDKKGRKNDEDEPFSPSLDVPDYVRAAEEFVAITYLAFIQNTLGRIRTILFGMLVVFVAMTLGVASYPFEPLPVVGAFFLALFVAAGAILVIVYGAMNRDSILSYVTNTNPGELGWSFWGQLITFAATPLFALLTTLFPSLADFLLSWVQPSAGSLK